MQAFTFGLFVADAKHCCLICDDERVSLYVPHLVFKRGLVQLDAFQVCFHRDRYDSWMVFQRVVLGDRCNL